MSNTDYNVPGIVARCGGYKEEQKHVSCPEEDFSSAIGRPVKK